MRLLPLVLMGALACQTPERVVCADVALEACAATEGCRVVEGFPAYVDVESGWSCWEEVKAPAACGPVLDEARCPVEAVLATPSDDAACMRFDTVCSPERWDACGTPPADRPCPTCEDEALPPFVGPGLRLTGEGRFGRQVAMGDLDGDGDLDLVVASERGVTVVAGGALSADGPRWSLRSEDSAAEREVAIAVADLDGDGQDDLVVGAPAARTPTSGSSVRPGGVYVFFGPMAAVDGQLEDAQLLLVGDRVGDELGAAVHVGDLDGDGQDDLVAWARSADAGGRADATLDVFLGPLAPGQALSSERRAATVLGQESFGATVGLGDLDGDGADELVVGVRGLRVVSWRAPWQGELTSAQAVAWDAAAPTEVTTGDVGAVAVGDVDGDGRADLVLGVPAATTPLHRAGRVLAVAGPLPAEGGRVTAVTRLRGRCGLDETGTLLAIDDLDGDSVQDLLVGASPSGAANVAGTLLPGPLPPGEALVTARGVRLGAGTWGSTMALGDLDGDGRLDVAVGAPGTDEVRVWFSPGAR
ncbi:MAG: FG-GAP repeat protein [Alphaproteobacteria bacterium]|nr:FG-GAP repeat protein [Alphaproteobacteria bacterium]